MKHNKFLMVSVGFLFFGAQHLSADPVAMGFDDLQAQAQNSLAATRAQFQWQEPFSEEAQLSTPQKSTATRKSADMPAVENQWQVHAARGAMFVANQAQNYINRGAGPGALGGAYHTGKEIHKEHKQQQAQQQQRQQQTQQQKQKKAKKGL